MVKRTFRGWAAQAVTATQIAKRMSFSHALWKTKRGMLRMLGKRAGTPKRMKITIIVEYMEKQDG